MYSHFKHINLTDDQSNAIEKLQDFLQSKEQIFIIKGYAGSGKTTTIINRIENLVNNGVREGAIILTTFTRDATKDMRKKLQKKSPSFEGL